MIESPWGPPLDVLPALAREEQALLDVLGELDAAQWAAPVPDLAAHILGSKLRRLSRDRDGHHADPESPGEWVSACRVLSPEVLFTLLVDCSSQIVDLWKRRDPDELDAASGVPVWLASARDYTEFWVLQQRIREAAGVPLLDEPEFVSPVVETFMRTLPHALGESTAPKGKRVSYVVSGSAGGTWTAARGADDWTLDQRPPPRAPFASVSTDVDTFWRLCTRAVRPADVRDRIIAAGDAELCEALLRVGG
jgi:hypothetical protein